MNHAFFIMVLCGFFTITPTWSLQARDGENKPKTIRTEDKEYITTGTVTLAAPIDTARQIIADTDHWNDWMFIGMDGKKPAERFLLVYIPGVNFTTPNEMTAFVEFRVLRSLGKDRTPIPFILTRQYTATGKLSGVVVVLAHKNAMLKSARYEISLSGTEYQTEISYLAKVRLRGFFEFFVTLNSYTNTIEWYLNKIIGNFVQRVDP